MAGRVDVMLTEAIVEALVAGVLVIDDADQLGAVWIGPDRRAPIMLRRGPQWEERLDVQAALYRPWADAPPGRSIRALAEGRITTYRCPRCGRVSAHLRDVEEGYCSACHDWTRDG